MVVQITKTHIFYVWWPFTQPKEMMIWYLDSAHQNSWKTLSFSNSYAHTDQNLISNQLLQQWQNGCSSNKNTYYFMFDDLTLNKKQKWFDIWIQHNKTVGNHSLSVIHMLTHMRNKFPTSYYSSDKMVVQSTKTHIML